MISDWPDRRMVDFLAVVQAHGGECFILAGTFLLILAGFGAHSYGFLIVAAQNHK